MTGVVTFDSFLPGNLMGEVDLAYDPILVERWQRIFGPAQPGDTDSSAEGAGMVVVMMMRAYLSIVAPRPPGNVHARQQISLKGTPYLGESVRTRITCVNKEIKRERRFVELDAIGTGEGGRSIYTARITLIWAA